VSAMSSKGSATAYKVLGFVVWKTVMRSVRRDAGDARAKIRERRIHIAGGLAAATAAIAVAAALAHRSNGSQTDI
jgi:hypothetical protein